MIAYFIVLLVYILIKDVVFYFTHNLTIALISKFVVMAVLLYVFREKFKFRMKFDLLAVLIGLVVAVLWVALDSYYPHIGSYEAVPYGVLDIIIKMMNFVVITPVVEEVFTRFFLIRWVISKEWQKIEIGKYTLGSFLVSVMFFGLSHSRWLPGLIAGVLFNLLLYKRKNIESCILAHAIANLALGIYVIYTGNWHFW